MAEEALATAGEAKRGRRRTSSRNLFLSCFGFSEVDDSKKKSPIVIDEVSSEKRKHRWLLRLRLRFRPKKSTARTVPVPETSDGSGEIRPLKSEKKRASSKRRSSGVAVAVAVVGSDSIVNGTDSKDVERQMEFINVNQQFNEEQSDDKVCVKDDSGHKGPRSHHKRKGSKAIGADSQELQENKGVSTPTQLVPLQSASFLPTKRGGGHKQDPGRHQFDSVIGMSIVLVTLVIMVFWGKVCAILCTSAWFFMVPRLRSAIESDLNLVEPIDIVDFDSEEYKKKVVLEGFLKRKRANIPRIL